MSAATDRVTELRAELAKAEQVAKVEAQAQREAERRARRAKLEGETDEYRTSEYAAYAGPHDSYVAISSYSDGIELNLCEFTSFNTSVTLNREDALALATSIQQFLR